MLPKHVKRVRAKGREYFYFDTGKRVDGKKVYAKLPHLRAPEFGGRYAALLGHRNRNAPAELTRVPKLVELYEKSAAWAKHSPATQRVYAIYLARLEKLLPTAPVAEITRIDMQKLFDDMGATPSAANAFIRTASALFTWGKKRGYVPANPCDEIEKNDGGEHQPWPSHVLDAALVSDDAVVRLLTHLLYYTGQRLGDVRRMAWTDIADGRIRVRQAKTGKLGWIRMHEKLAAELATRPRDAVLICTKSGRAIGDDTARKALQAFGTTMGVEVVPHGLRKNAVITLLAVGCSIAETAAITLQSLRMVEHYAKERDQAALADAAVLRWEKNA